jgi:hypothetical protein
VSSTATDRDQYRFQPTMLLLRKNGKQFYSHMRCSKYLGISSGGTINCMLTLKDFSKQVAIAVEATNSACKLPIKRKFTQDFNHFGNNRYHLILF